MTVVVGIHQKQDKIQKLYENMGLRAIALSSVGPFPSKAEALAWQKTIREKIGQDHQIIDPDGPDESGKPWYGFSFKK